MANIPLPKRGFTSNPNTSFTSHKSVYDDVFGGQPKFGLPTLAPRLEDYVEIFGGFHSSRSSSIPVIDIPVIGGDDSELHFDGISYGEVFGEPRGLDYTASFEDVVGQSSGGYDSSDESWSPAKSGTLSDEMDPLAGSDASCRFSEAGGDSHQSLQNKTQLNVSYSKSGRRVMEKVFAEASHGTKFGAVSGHTTSYFGAPISVDGDGEYECCSVPVIDDLKHKKCLSNPSENGSCTHKSDYSASEEQENDDTFSLERPFMSVSDLSLRTRPSRLPPPSRPPPALVDNKGVRTGSNSKHTASKSYGFEKVVGGSMPPSFDVDVDATRSISAIRNGNKEFNMKRVSTKGSVERVDSWDDSKWHLQDAMEEEEQVHQYGSFEGEKKLQSYREHPTSSAPSAKDRTEEFPVRRGMQYRQHFTDIPACPVAWREKAEYFEVSEKDISEEHIEVVVGSNVNVEMHFQDPEAYRTSKKTESKACKQNEDVDILIVKKDVARWDEEGNQFEMPGEAYYWSNKHQSKETEMILGGGRKEFEERVTISKQAHTDDLSKMVPHNDQQAGESGMAYIDLDVSEEGGVEADCILKEVNQNYSLNVPFEINRFINGETTKGSNVKYDKSILSEEYQHRLHNVGRAGIREGVEERKEQEATENKLVESAMLVENEQLLKEAKGNGESGKESCIAVLHERKGEEKMALYADKDKVSCMEAVKERSNELTFIKASEQAENDKGQGLVSESGVAEERTGDAILETYNDLRDSKAGTEPNKSLSGDAGLEKLSEEADEDKPIEMNRNDAGIHWDHAINVPIKRDNVKLPDRAFKFEEETAIKSLAKDDNSPTIKKSQEAVFGGAETPDQLVKGNFSRVGMDRDELLVENTSIEKSNTAQLFSSAKQLKDSIMGGTRRDTAHTLSERSASPMGHSHETGKIKFVEDKGETTTKQTHRDTASTLSERSASSMGHSHETGKIKFVEDKGETTTKQIHRDTASTFPVRSASPMGHSHEIGKINSVEDKGEPTIKQTQVVIEEAAMKASSTPCQVVKGSKGADALPVLGHDEDQLSSRKISKNQVSETRDRNVKENIFAKEQKVVNRIRRDIEQENEHLRKLEEEREREREREKDRMAVDKAVFDAYEKSYAEAREKADRAAVARATAEVRQRAMAQARERLEKASLEARQRAEYAMERATAETRQRAMEKSTAERAAFERMERSTSGKFSVSSGSADMRQGSKTSDIHFQDRGTPSGFRHSIFPSNTGAEGESPQRCKARLERYRRTAERAANALAEKNKRDLFAQKEREERNRIAETLDAEVKRWSRGKEGNLRALLSTLQYILGANSGWQPVPLTEVITTVAVKKAYRKATLFVHPDKLQQRGATIQQKYICEKVFDLLKEAWNKFNSEER